METFTDIGPLIEGSGDTDRPTALEASAQNEARARLTEIARLLSTKPFRPHPLFKGGHAQTLAAYAWPLRSVLRVHAADEARLFEAEPGVRLLAHCRWQPDRASRPTLILIHGLEGSSESAYMLRTAHLAYQAGFNVLRLNLRNCGATEHLTPTLYHSGMTGDLLTVINELIERDRLSLIFLAGFSMSGNMVLKLAGERGERAPRELVGVCAVSPSINISACAERIERRSNWIYLQGFMRSLRRRLRIKKKLYPELYDTTGLHRMRTVRDFDERYTVVHGGFESAADYYASASALPLIPRIRRPTLIIHAQDDPIVPYDSFDHPSITNNPYIVFIAPPHGGHVAFVAARDGNPENRFWAENRIVEFCQLILSGGGGGGAVITS